MSKQSLHFIANSLDFGDFETSGLDAEDLPPLRDCPYAPGLARRDLLRRTLGVALGGADCRIKLVVAASAMAAASCRPQVGGSIGMVFDKRDGAFC
jgi:hypothetical protein